MSITASRNDAWQAGLDAGCERLVHPRVTGAGERARQRRFIGTLLTAPFVIAPALSPALAGTLSGSSLLAAVCAVFAAAWACSALVAVTGSRTFAEPIALTLGVLAVGGAVAGGGSLAHPVALLAIGLAFEAWWIGRTGRHATVGVLAAAASLVLPSVAGHYLSVPGAGPSVWAWLAPGLYFASVAPRLLVLARPAQEKSTTPSIQDMGQLLGASIMRLSSSGEVLEATEQADALFGLPRGLLAGRSLFERVHVGDRVAFMNALANAGAGEAKTVADLRIRTLGSETGADEKFLPVSVELVSQPSGELIVLVRDRTAVAQMQSEIEAARQKADSTEIAKNRFLAAVSHELRTPLNAIIGFSDMMLNDLAGELSNQQREYAGLISRSGNHLLSVVNAILDVSKIESGAYSIRPEPFVVDDAVELCRSMMAHQAETQGVELTVSVRPDVRELDADRRAVQQIIINLLSNAIKFTPAGGSVSLEVYRLGGKMSFVVSDTGIGIAEHDMGKLGRPFTQVSNDTTRKFEGAGLGLSLVKGLVALHEGVLSIESAPDEGTVVTVTLPVDHVQSSQQEDVATETKASGTVHAMELRARDETVRKTA